MTGRILIVSPGDSRSGAGQFRHALALGLQARGHAIVLAQPAEDGPDQAAEAALGIEHHFFTRNPYDGIAAFGNDSALATAELSRSAPDLVLFNSGISPGCLYSFLDAADRGRIPYLLVEHQVAPELFAFGPAGKARFSALYSRARAVVTVSAENLRVLRQCLDLPPHLGQVIVSGRPPAFFRPCDAANRAALRRAWSVPDDALVVLTVAKLEPVKGHDLLLAAMHRLRAGPAWKKLHFVWIGDGQSRAALEAGIAAAGIGEHIRLLGHRHDVAALYDGGDVMAMTSVSEGMPLTVMEAMAKGLPPLCTEVGGTAEAIGDAGILLPPPGDDGRTVAALVTALEALVRDRRPLAALAERARLRACALFQEARMIDEYADLIARASGSR